MSIYKDQLEEMVSSWTEEQLTEYITKLETRVKATELWLKELRKLRALKKRALHREAKDTGHRHG